MRTYGKSNKRVYSDTLENEKKVSLHSYFSTSNVQTSSVDTDRDSKKNERKEKQLVQLYLDPLVESGCITCKKCGMAFHSGDPNDRIQHENFHNIQLHQKIPWKKDKSDSSYLIVGLDLRKFKYFACYNYPSIHDLSKSKKLLLLEHVLPMIEQEMGSIQLDIKQDKGLLALVNVKDSMLVSLVIYTKDIDHRTITVYRIWTRRDCRRNGYATACLDILSNRDRSMIQFEGTTTIGQSFFESFKSRIH
jgi:hypothetical protein